jgi:hypothetical protein
LVKILDSSRGKRFTGNIDDISIERFGGYIVEYDSKSNTVTPVIVDKTGFLQFSRDRLITGINIIDDMLFWTDNFSEPKKINIPRSIQGTDSSGLIHSNFINTKTSLEVPMKEEHVTVIKKQPTHAPKIKLISERESGIDSVSGITLELLWNNEDNKSANSNNCRWSAKHTEHVINVGVWFRC